MEQFELEDENWEEVLEVVRAEATKRGISESDFSEMLLLMKRIWKILVDKVQRQRKILHSKHIKLSKDKVEQTDNLQITSDELARLKPDPGDPIPEPPKPIVVPPLEPEPILQPPVGPGPIN